MRIVRRPNPMDLVGALAAPRGAAIGQRKRDPASADAPTIFQTVNLDRLIHDVEMRTDRAPTISHRSNASLLETNAIRRTTQCGRVATGDVLDGLAAVEDLVESARPGGRYTKPAAEDSPCFR